MKILQVHNFYQQKTGEETVVEEEKKVLEKNGHQVVQFLKDNSSLDQESKLSKAKMLLNLRSSKAIEDEFREVLQNEQPDICHVHNTFPIITPGIFKICKETGVPVVKSLHNYKMVCTKSTLFRKGEVCTKCLNKNLYKSIKYRCYRNSFLATALQADVIQHHRNIDTWPNQVDLFLALTEFQKEIIVEGGGLPNEKVIVKPNFISTQGKESIFEDFVLFVGKVDDYKGKADLLYAIENSPNTNFVVIGEAMQGLFDQFNNVNYLGHKDKSTVMDYLRRCKVVLFPSKNYEGMPMVILESFSVGKPVICRDLGAMSTMIKHNVNGLHYNSLKELLQVLNDIEIEKLKALGTNAFKDFQCKYTESIGYQNLMEVYKGLLNIKESK